MKKLLLFVAAMVMSFGAMAEDPEIIWDWQTTNLFGIPGSAVKDAETSYTYTDGDDSYTITLWGDAGNGFKWSGNAGSKYLIMGKTGAYLTFPAFDFPVSKIELVGNSGASASVVHNIFVGDEAVSTAVTGAKGTSTFEIAADYRAAGTVYTLKVTSAHNTQINVVKIYKYDENATPATKYDVEFANVEHGTITASKTSVEEGEEVTLTATPAGGYEFAAWDVKDADNNTITVTNNVFTMPASNVTVSATFNPLASDADISLYFVESGSDTDASGAYTTVASAFGELASEYVSAVVVDKVYPARSGRGAKFGSSSAVGSIAINLQNTYTVSKIVVCASGYASSDRGNLVVNGESKTMSTYGDSFAEYEFDFASEPVDMSEITVASASNGGKYRIYVKYIKVYGSVSSTPEIQASNVELTADATSGEIEYTIVNAIEGVNPVASITAGDWISNVTVDAANGKITFDATANTAHAVRTAEVTISYTGAEDAVVTITQNMASITEIVPVAESTTWDFSLIAAAVGGRLYDKNAYILFGNEVNVEGFNADALMGKQQYIVRNNTSIPAWQGTELVFRTTVPGTVTVNWCSTSNTNERAAVINGVVAEYSTETSKDKLEEFVQVVPAGDVVIGGLDKKEGVVTVNQIRIYSMTFTPLDEDDIETTYVLVGSKELFGGDVDYLVNEDNAMIYDEANNRYTKTYTVTLAEGKYYYGLQTVAHVAEGASMMPRRAGAASDAKSFEIAEEAEYTIEFRYEAGVLTAIDPVSGFATSVENASAEKAQKLFIDGQIVIVKDGVRYNAIGLKL